MEGWWWFSLVSAGIIISMFVYFVHQFGNDIVADIVFAFKKWLWTKWIIFYVFLLMTLQEAVSCNSEKEQLAQIQNVIQELPPSHYR